MMSVMTLASMIEILERLVLTLISNYWSNLLISRRCKFLNGY